MSRLIVVSNRMPIGGKLAPGGLATALDQVLRRRTGLWVGWSGELTETPTKPHLQETRDYAVAGVDLSQNDYEGYCAGFSNSVLWPIFHLRPDLAQIEPGSFEAYMRVNEQFADAVAGLAEADDLIWVHDYHLIPLGSLLRRRGMRNRIGFFLHIPWPTSEALSVVPSHRELASTLTAYDVVGLQANRDLAALNSFASEEQVVCARNNAEPQRPPKILKAEVFPVGSDPDCFSQLATSPEGTKIREAFQQVSAGRQLILGVDRLDYTKGLPQRIAAYQRLLEAYPEHRRNVSFMQIAPPSRATIAQYRELSEELDSACGRVMAAFAEPDWHPLNHVRRPLDQARLAGLYRAARVGLVTPLRDGMNLVAHEYIGSQDPDDPGVLVLSIFAGAAEIFPQALLVNPYDPSAMARAMDTALRMSLAERQERWRGLSAATRRYSISAWASGFLAELSAPTVNSPGPQADCLQLP